MTQPQLMDDPDIPLEDPSIPIEDDPEIALDEQPPPVSAALVEILPADFPLPALLRFVPDARLKQAADEATRYALAVEVAGPEGLQRADVALSALRSSLKAITDHFENPAELANRVHKGITGKRAEWLEAGTAAVRVVGQRIATEQLRLQRLADDERRRRQEEEDRKASEEARRRAEDAAKAKAPEPVVQELRKQAEIATAPPVVEMAPAPKLTGSSVMTTWKARIAGTPAHAEPLPESAEFSPAQRAQVLILLKAIVDGTAPIHCIQLDASYLNARAKSEKKTLQIPGIEAFEDVGTRARPARRK